ncbi:MAG TPA: branched-chain amino acid ABC transporter permease [Ktedonobacterales bacterium]
MLVLAALGVNGTALLQQLVDGIAVGAIYALVALGYTLVYGIIELINFAHGDVFAWGAVATAFVLELMGFNNFSASLSGLSLIGVMALLLVVGMAFCGGLNFVIERVAYRPLRRAPRLAPLIAAIGVSFILETVIQLTRGGGFIEYPTLFPAGGIHLGGVIIKYLDIFILALAIVLMYLLNRLIQKTKIGRGMRATAQDPEAASLMGVNINRTISFTFIVGGALAGAGSVMYGLALSGVKYNTGFEAGLIAFAAAVLGGIGNIYGAVLGGLLIGIIQSYTVLAMGAQWSDVTAFAVLVLIFVFRPSGLLGQQVPDKV